MANPATRLCDPRRQILLRDEIVTPAWRGRLIFSDQRRSSPVGVRARWHFGGATAAARAVLCSVVAPGVGRRARLLETHRAHAARSTRSRSVGGFRCLGRNELLHRLFPFGSVIET